MEIDSRFFQRTLKETMSILSRVQMDNLSQLIPMENRYIPYVDQMEHHSQQMPPELS